VGIRSFAKWLNGTASQFNVYWDEALQKVVIEPGAYYTGANPNYVGHAPDVEVVHVSSGTYPVWDTDVTLTNGFYIGKYEVTQEQWKALWV
jgi:formylglycine-generating enzyme required for sulfatase activity